MGVKSPVQQSVQPPNKASTVNEQDKAIIKEFQKAMASGDHRAALRAEAKYRRIDVKPEKNIYDYGPNDPDPTVDYYFEPLKPRRTGKVRQRRPARTRPDRRRDRRLFKHARARAACRTRSVQLAEAAEAHNTPILPNPLARKRKNPTIRSP